MLNVIILALILTGLVVHRYLSLFLEAGLLPYSLGFLLFVKAFAVTCLVSFVWMFGAVAGFVAFLLCLFQVIYSAGLWIFVLPWLIALQGNRSLPRVSPLLYGGFSFLVTGILGLTVVNFFVSPYRSMWDAFGEDVWTAVLVFAGVVIVGNILRMAVMSKTAKYTRTE